MSLFGIFKHSEPGNLPVVREVAARPDSALEQSLRSALPPDAVSPEKLRQELVQAISSGNDEKLKCLCQTHEKSIFDRGVIWMRLPSRIRANPKLLKWYGNGVGLIARTCAQRLNKPELLERVRQIEKRLSAPKAVVKIPNPPAIRKPAPQPVVKIMAALQERE